MNKVLAQVGMKFRKCPRLEKCKLIQTKIRDVIGRGERLSERFDDYNSTIDISDDSANLQKIKKVSLLQLRR